MIILIIDTPLNTFACEQSMSECKMINFHQHFMNPKGGKLTLPLKKHKKTKAIMPLSTYFSVNRK